MESLSSKIWHAVSAIWPLYFLTQLKLAVGTVHSSAKPRSRKTLPCEILTVGGNVLSGLIAGIWDASFNSEMTGVI